MAFLINFSLRHNLSKTPIFSNKLADVIVPRGQQVRYLPRWAHRHPIRIVNEDDSSTNQSNYAKKLKIENETILHMPVKDESHSEDQLPFKSKEETHFSTEIHQPVSYKHNKFQSEYLKKPDKRTEVKNKSDGNSKTKKEKKHEKKMEIKINRLRESAMRAGVPVYSKLAADDSKLSELMLIAKSKNPKVKRSHIVLEGKRLIKDAIEAGYVPEHVFFSRVSDAADLNLPDGINIYKIPYKNIELWSELSTPPGIMGFLKTPNTEKMKPGKDALPLTIICDNIRDPGNLGTILRGAAGVGCQKVILTKGCVDPWEPKVLRSAAGAHFRTPVISAVEWENLESHVDSEASVFLADNNIDPSSLDQDETSETVDLCTESYEKCFNSVPVMPYFTADYPNCGPIVLIIGGETQGLSMDSFKLANERAGVRLNIPLSNGVDSLNSGIALGVIVFEMKRQFLNKISNKQNKDNSEEIVIEALGI